MTSQEQVVVNVIAVVPPPYNGMTAVSQEFANELSRRFRTKEFLIKRPRFIRSSLWPLYRQIALLWRVVEVLILSRGPIYFVLDSGLGVWGNYLVHLPLLALSRRVLIVHHHVFSYLHKYDPRVGGIIRMGGERALHIVLCDCMQEGFRSLYPKAGNILALANASFSNIEKTSRKRERLRRVGFLGNITREKGIGLFMRTVRELRTRGLLVDVDIGGPIADRVVEKEVNAFVAEDPGRRRFVGPVYGTEKQEFFDHIDVLLFPSQYINEAQPVTIYEALASGVPVLATERGCVPEQLREEWVFPEEDYVSKVSGTLSCWASDERRYALEVIHAEKAWNDAVDSSRQQFKVVCDSIVSLGVHN